MHFQEM